MSTLHVALLRVPVDERELRGRDKVHARSRLAREAVAGSAARAGAILGRLEKDAEDAPIATNGWHWSLSHGGEFVAGVVSRSPVGLDVETVAPRRQELVPRVTSRDELELLGGFTWEVFARVWTAKEAVLKKAGCGLLELSRCRVVAVEGPDTLVLNHRDRDHVVHVRVAQRHAIALAHDGPADTEIAWLGLEARERGDLAGRGHA